MRSLRLHPLRSSLTILGILVGVASVIWLLAIGQGISSAAQRADRKSGGRQHHRPLDQAAQTKRSTPRPRGVVPVRPHAARLRTPAGDHSHRSSGRCRFASCSGEFRRQDHLVDGRLVGCTPEYADGDSLGDRSGPVSYRRRSGSSSTTSACWRPRRPSGCFRSRTRWDARCGSRTCTTSWSASRSRGRPRPASAARWRRRTSPTTSTFRSHDSGRASATRSSRAAAARSKARSLELSQITLRVEERRQRAGNGRRGQGHAGQQSSRQADYGVTVPLGTAGASPHHAADVHDLHGHDRGDFAGGRRHRHHEHHAGHGHRAHPRDRHSPRRRGQAQATSRGSSWSKRSCCRSWAG